MIDSDVLRISLNLHRGLAIESLLFREILDRPLVGTLSHGYYDDIGLGADYYTGHLILEAPGKPKVTDLGKLDPRIVWEKGSQRLCVSGQVPTPLGPVWKCILIHLQGKVTLRYHLDWDQIPSGSLRLGHVTVNPEAFVPSSLFFTTHNGGISPERFTWDGGRIEHGRSVSFLVSASSALGMTAGTLSIGDENHVMCTEMNHGAASLVAQITCIPIGKSFFCRISFSASELDDTVRDIARFEFPRDYEITMSAHLNQTARMAP